MSSGMMVELASDGRYHFFSGRYYYDFDRMIRYRDPRLGIADEQLSVKDGSVCRYINYVHFPLVRDVQESYQTYLVEVCLLGDEGEDE